MKIQDIRKHKKIALLGFAREGEATLEYLKKFHPDAEIGILDQKTDPQYLSKVHDYDLVIKTPVIRPEAVPVPYITATNIFFANSEHRTIGITGTKGKSTAVSLLLHILKSTGMKVELFGNIGIPMLNALTHEVPKDTLIILELSNYQLEDIQFSPNTACILNIYKELHNHPSFESYAQTKWNITKFQNPKDTLVFNGQYPEITSGIAASKAQKIDFSKNDLPKMNASSQSFMTHTDTLKAVYTLAHLEGVNDQQFLTALDTFEPLPHRLHTIGDVGGITWVEDSASTHPSATINALQLTENVHTVFIGGEDRGYDFHELVNVIIKHSVKEVILFPNTQNIIEDIFKQHLNIDINITCATTMKDAVDLAFNVTPKGGTVLMSPGAPSYSMYKNFPERGKDYVQCIHSHEKKEGTKN